jgi:hypothetical protein
MLSYINQTEQASRLVTTADNLQNRLVFRQQSPNIASLVSGNKDQMFDEFKSILIKLGFEFSSANDKELVKFPDDFYFEKLTLFHKCISTMQGKINAQKKERFKLILLI